MGQAQPSFSGRCHNVALGDILPEGASVLSYPSYPQRGAGHCVGNMHTPFMGLS